ncbi:MAG TPA: enoyl-ACP reductase [Planctomycetota bacterium]|nr:enoyl-ACP reductase [Planctomycetota bacterium]
MLLNGKTGIVLGVANKRSIAWAIARRAAEEGARLCVTYQNERLRENVASLCAEMAAPPLLLPCDVTAPGDVEALTAEVKRAFGGLDFLVHALAFAKKEELDGAFYETTEDGWNTALGVSAYSLVKLTKACLPLMEGRRGSVVTMTYLGSERVVPHYNVMGVAKAALESSVRYLAADVGPTGHRVNAVSAGPIKTLAAAGISGFSQVLDMVAMRAPMRRNVDATEVADATLFLLSDYARGVTGETLYVDCGFHATGL